MDRKKIIEDRKESCRKKNTGLQQGLSIKERRTIKTKTIN
jgi:hypothetical protein